MADQDTGVIVTQGNVPVQIAADYQKTIDTRWRFLDIENEQEFEMLHTASGASHYWVEKLLDHNLGYLPAFTYREISAVAGVSYEIIATKKAIYARSLYVNTDPVVAFRLQGFLRVFACSITAPYKAPVDFIVPGTPVAVSNTGVKVLKTVAKGMYSGNPADFSFNTQAKALAIQQTGSFVAASPDFKLVVEHNLGYPPTYWAAHWYTPEDFAALTVFANPLPGEDYIRPMLLPTGARVTADSNFIRIEGAQSALVGKFGVLVTKEPVELAV